MSVALELHGVSKSYPGTPAVREVDLQIRAGEVHALVGENGAGKSTLMKILAGSFDDYTGEVLMDGRPVELRAPALAKAAGIGMIHQELSLAPPLSLAENILAGRLPSRRGLLDRAALRREAVRCLDLVGLSHLEPETPVEDLSQHEAQLVEIAKALGNQPRILVMDEPTSALGREEVERLFGIIRRLRELGIAIVYISHHLPEVFALADRVTVLRDGRCVGTRAIGEVTSKQVVELMIGGSAASLYARRANPPGEALLRVEDLTRWGFFHHCSFEVRAGEVVGLGGLAGAGRSELARSLCGVDPRDGGVVRLAGRALAPHRYADAVRAGLAYLPEERKSQGLALRLSVMENLLAAVIPRCCRAGVYQPAREPALRGRWLDGLNVQPPDPLREVGTLSGGNQQKVLLAKWLATDPRVLILDEPTRGVDVGAKAIIHRAIAEAADRGTGVILISSDLPELVGLADRVLILRRGRLVGELSGPGCTEEAVLLAANGEEPVAVS
ncbi:MAG: sugar ABC transporter ATP-binding protein [Armatimonadetes bacterium]|nr:sugar ABC transporter ATP-binding protein [Armatimonadota bacterium]